MKYRIKDETERRLIKALFGITEFTSEFQDKSLTIRASFAGDDFGVWFFETEPVQELADGWNPYPQSKPQKNGKYLIAIGEGDLCFVDIGNFAGKSFAAWNPDIIAWREMPKIWKEMEK